MQLAQIVQDVGSIRHTRNCPRLRRCNGYTTHRTHQRQNTFMLGRQPSGEASKDRSLVYRLLAVTGLSANQLHNVD